jgi:hypothetical protein
MALAQDEFIPVWVFGIFNPTLKKNAINVSYDVNQRKTTAEMSSISTRSVA